MTGDSPYFVDWLEIAKKDWKRMNIMLKEGDIDAAGYFLQQSLEKHLKAYNLKNGGKLKKLHELDALLDETIKFNPELSSFYPLCERVSSYFMTLRYPTLTEEKLEYKDIRADIIEAEKLVFALFPY